MPIPIYIPPLLMPTTLSSPLPPSLSFLIPFISSLNSYILFIPLFISLPTMP